MSKIIDLSVTIKNRDKGQLEPAYIKYFSHKKGGNLLGLGGCILTNASLSTRIKNLFLYIFGLRRLISKDFPDGLGLAWEKLYISTHCGTHLDSPFHYGPTCNDRLSLTVDKIPLEYCFSDGVILDFKSKKAGEIIAEEDLEREFKKINYQLKPKDIVLIMTGRDKLLHKKEYPFSHPGLSKEATEWIINKGVKIIGIDTWSIDRPINFMIKDYLKYKDKNLLWPAHLAGRKREFFHIEQLANLEAIPKPFGFKVACLPIKIENASAGWCRVVAIIEY